jgi:predicted nucleic acid-binding protein
MFVIDASVTVAWCFEDEASDATESLLRRLLTEGGLAPGHWPFEVANALRSGERRGRLGEAKLSVARSLLETLPVDIAPSDVGGALGVLDIARSHDLSVYDAAYLDLAASRNLGLATVDQRLAAACRTAGISVIG